MSYTQSVYGAPVGTTELGVARGGKADKERVEEEIIILPNK